MNSNLGKTGYRNVEQILCLHPKKTEKLELGLPISVDKATTVYVPIKKIIFGNRICEQRNCYALKLVAQVDGKK